MLAILDGKLEPALVDVSIGGCTYQKYIMKEAYCPCCNGDDTASGQDATAEGEHDAGNAESTAEKVPAQRIRHQVIQVQIGCRQVQ